MGTDVKTGRRTGTDATADAMQRQLWKLIRGLGRCDQEFLSRYGVTTAQGETLLALPGDSGVSMNELSRAMGLANSSMTRMVEHLVAKGLLSRREDDRDRRIVRVALTARGRTVQGSLREARREIQKLIFSEIRNEEREGILEVLTRLNGALENVMKGCCDD